MSDMSVLVTYPIATPDMIYEDHVGCPRQVRMRLDVLVPPVERDGDRTILFRIVQKDQIIKYYEGITELSSLVSNSTMNNTAYMAFDSDHKTCLQYCEPSIMPSSHNQIRLMLRSTNPIIPFELVVLCQKSHVPDEETAQYLTRKIRKIELINFQLQIVIGLLMMGLVLGSFFSVQTGVDMGINLCVTRQQLIHPTPRFIEHLHGPIPKPIWTTVQSYYSTPTFKLKPNPSPSPNSEYKFGSS